MLSDYAEGYNTTYAYTHYMSEEEGLGEVLIDNFSFFLTNKCTITDYS